MKPVRIATRGSDLALWQARYVARRIESELCRATELTGRAALGPNPQGRPLLDPQGDLWVINNGGFAPFSRGPRRPQVPAPDDPTADPGVRSCRLPPLWILGLSASWLIRTSC